MDELRTLGRQRRRFRPGLLHSVFFLYLVTGIIVTVIEYNKGIKLLYGEDYFHYNNFIIFKESWFNLLAQVNLYVPHPDQFFDLYKYSPSFPLLMIPMAYLPNLAGLLIWNVVVNTLLVYVAVVTLPVLTQRQKALFLLLLIVDVMTSLHNAQSNGLMTALFILAFALVEKQWPIWSVLCVMLMAFTKLFGLAALLIFALYPHKGRSATAIVGWTAILALLPLVFIDVSYLAGQYREWLELLTSDHARSLGVSLLGLVDSWFGLSLPKIGSVLVGAALLVVPLVRLYRDPQPQVRLLFLASIMIWVVIFNHKAESSTFVIAMAGVLLWYFAGSRSIVHHILLVLALVLVSFSPTDLFPAIIRGEYVVPLRLKALPPIVIWLTLNYELISGRRLLASNHSDALPTAL